MELRDRTAVITGGASGIGAACARAFAARGARVVVADVQTDLAQAVADEIGGHAVRCDVGREADVNALVAEAEERFGPIDMFFSNAAVATGGDPLTTPIEVWDDQWQINLMAHLFAIRAVLPGMLERESGYLLHTASSPRRATPRTPLRSMRWWDWPNGWPSPTTTAGSACRSSRRSA